ncbi:MAG: response regulator, partial [Clostridia bacterium]|nr:response regulator [Clostridia bacterium]
MLKVLLVDDEEIIRSGIAQGIDWAQLGFQVIGEAEDGEQALQAVKEMRPDVVITDIKMPFMDGLQFIEAVKPQYPNVSIIIISGHDEFHYAQKAVKLGAYDYILKPIELEYLKEILVNIRKEHEVELEKEMEVNHLRDKISENICDLKEKFIEDVLYGKLSAEEILNKAGYFGIDSSYDSYTAIAVQMDDYYLV